MLHRVGTAAEALALDGTVPDDVLNDIVYGAEILDSEYGAERNYLVDGGYALIAYNRNDVEMALRIIGDRLCEWVIKLGGSGWTSVLYLIGDEYASVLYAPEAALPAALLNQMEEDKQ